MGINADISSALNALESIFGETVSIDTWTGLATVIGGAQGFETVFGGVYEGISFTINVRKDALPAGFKPVPPMPVVVRGYELRIAPSGVIDYRAHWRLLVVERNVPSR